MYMDLESCFGICVWSSGSRQEEERGERKEQHREGRPEHGQHHRPFPRAEGLWPLLQMLRNCLLMLRSQDFDRLKDPSPPPFPLTSVNQLFYSRLNFILKKIQ